MKMEELRAKTEDQLKDQLVALKKEAFNLRFQQTTGELENTSRIRTVRRSIARVKTLLEGGDTAPSVKKEASKKKSAAAKKPAAKGKKETTKKEKAA